MNIKNMGEKECVIQSTRRRRLARIDPTLPTDKFSVGDTVMMRWTHPLADTPARSVGLVLEVNRETSPPNLTVMWDDRQVTDDWGDDLVKAEELD
jgi:hypothetical protein